MKFASIILLALFLSACTDKVNQIGSLVAAYQDGYQWAELHASAQSIPDCTPERDDLRNKMLTKGCQAYIDEHPEVLKIKPKPLDTVGEARVSIMQWPPIRQNGSEEDFDLGYNMALTEELTNAEECDALEGSYTFVNGCKQYITEISIVTEDETTPEMENNE